MSINGQPRPVARFRSFHADQPAVDVRDRLGFVSASSSHAAQHVLGRGPGLAGNDLASVHDEQRRDALHAVAPAICGDSSTLTLTSLTLPGVRPGQLLEGGADHAARPAPRRPQVDEHGQRGLARRRRR